MAKIPVHFHDEEFFEVQFKKTQALIRDLSAGKIKRDPAASTFKPEPPKPPAMSKGPVVRETVTHWQKRICTFMAAHKCTREEAVAFYRNRRAGYANAKRAEAAHG